MNKKLLLDTGSSLTFKDRILLEQLTLERVCASLFYDIADRMIEPSDEELIAIIEGDGQGKQCSDSLDTISSLKLKEWILIKLDTTVAQPS